MSPRILFVSHDASRTGAPIALLHLLEWLAEEKTDWRPAVLLGKGGDLLLRFEALAPTAVWDAPRRRDSLPQRLAARVRAPAPAGERWLRRIAAEGVDGVYAASAATARLLPPLRRYVDAPILCHVRELEYVLSRYVGTDAFRAAQPLVRHYLADSEATRRNLVDRHGVAPADVTTVYEGIPARRYRLESPAPDAGESRASFGILEDAFVLASGGSLQWRKGPDLFLQVVRRSIDRMRQPIEALWIGGPTRGEEYERFRHDVLHLGLDGHVRVTGFTDRPLEALASADVFLLTSREEPLGIMALEAAMLERPVACFDGAGGMAELLTNGRGFVVPYADADAMAEVVHGLWRDRALAAATGRRFADYVAEHHDISVVAAEVRDGIVRHLLRRQGARA